MSQKEELAKLADEQYGNGYYAMAKALEAAFLLGARAMQEKAVSVAWHTSDEQLIKALKPEELL